MLQGINQILMNYIQSVGPLYAFFAVAITFLVTGLLCAYPVMCSLSRRR